MRIAPLLYFLLLLSACQQEKAKQPAQDVNDPKDFSINLGKKVGPITSNSTLTDLQAIYGSENVVLRNIYTGEGQEQEGAILFPETNNELEIGWDVPANTGRPAFLRLSRIGGNWATSEGVKIHTTIDELQKLNGKPFSFYGLGWDYGGQVTNWNGGKFNTTLGVILGPSTDTLPKEVLGDIILSSDDPKVKPLGLRIDVIVLTFEK